MSKAWRWPPTQPIAAWIASCRSPSVISPGMRRRRQTGGLVPYSVTLRLRGVLLALLVRAAVLAMILISHRGAADLGLLRAACDDGKRVMCPPAGAWHQG